MASISAPRGTRDFLPASAAGLSWILDAHAAVAEQHGYRLIETPLFEATELFERGVGVGTDVVDKEMYTFPDRGSRSITLRPEGTPSAVRAVLAAHLEQEVRPVRVRYAGPMFRYDRPQAGRYRQFQQVGIECIGDGSPHLDVEVIEVASRLYADLGLDGVLLKLNSLGDADDRTRYRAALVDHFTPRLAELCGDCRRRLEVNPLRLLDCKVDAPHVAEAPTIAEYLSKESAAFFDTVCQGLDAAGIEYDLAPRLVRGLDYYAHTTFEFWHTSLQGAQNALGGGGRYDGLAGVLGFAATPGVGYALGVDRILLVALAAGLAPTAAKPVDAVVCAVAAGQSIASAAVARRLRDAGFSVVLDTGERKLDRKLRGADRLGARVAVIIGEDEAQVGTAMVRNLATRTQTTAAVHEIAATVRAVLLAETA